mmetsp:Transcript_1490/g.3215  ORF Transcript_1490/g.3215 Transcript_1490/m.3215 type:complete len:203 (+) Transcript_1490:4020-4628(+)
MTASAPPKFLSKPAGRKPFSQAHRHVVLLSLFLSAEEASSSLDSPPSPLILSTPPSSFGFAAPSSASFLIPFLGGGDTAPAAATRQTASPASCKIFDRISSLSCSLVVSLRLVLVINSVTSPTTSSFPPPPSSSPSIKNKRTTRVVAPRAYRTRGWRKVVGGSRTATARTARDPYHREDSRPSIPLRSWRWFVVAPSSLLYY